MILHSCSLACYKSHTCKKVEEEILIKTNENEDINKEVLVTMNDEPDLTDIMNDLVSEEKLKLLGWFNKKNLLIYKKKGLN